MAFQDARFTAQGAAVTVATAQSCGSDATLGTKHRAVFYWLRTPFIPQKLVQKVVSEWKPVPDFTL